jgi:hypothetical protein
MPSQFGVGGARAEDIIADLRDLADLRLAARESADPVKGIGRKAEIVLDDVGEKGHGAFAFSSTHRLRSVFGLGRG